jgi:MFS transporter, DHA1 family, multidrug resistance protein
VVARAVVVDVAKGDLLAKVMSIIMAIGGLAPMVAPVPSHCRGNVVTAADCVSSHQGCQVLRIRLYVGYMLTAALSGATMMAYIANSSYVLQVQKGLRPLPFALFFASTALAHVLLSIVNAKIVGLRFQPRTLIGLGLTLATLAVAALTVGVFALDTPLLLTCAGFLVLMAVQAFIFGSANALAAAEVPHIAGAASAVLGVTQAVAMATSAPLASSGGAATAVPMIWVMIAGVAGSLFAYLILARPSADRTIAPSPTEEPQLCINTS